MKHTPGPWNFVVNVQGASAWVEKAKSDGSFMQIACIDCTSLTNDENHANARLIATAPELLEMAEQLLERCYQLNMDIKGGTDAMWALEKVLEKARGES